MTTVPKVPDSVSRLEQYLAVERRRADDNRRYAVLFAIVATIECVVMIYLASR